jgi:predicted transposase/invertase (TIGR01784 family)
VFDVCPESDAMPLGIRPTVDFAFKKIFGSPQNSLSLIGLLNAILDLQRPIDTVEVLNPFNYQEFEDSKLIVLDIRCRDGAGRWLNVEMQVSISGGLLQRLVYYACSMYVDQLGVGKSYANATPAISICLLNRVFFRDTDQAHHRFQMMDSRSGRELNNAIEVHTVELTKYNLNKATIGRAGKLEQWAFLFLHAHEHDADDLKALLQGIEFHQAIGTIETISARTEDREMYDQREKAQRDYEWAISGAREEGIEQGIEVGIEQGIEVGIEVGNLMGRIQTLQELLGHPISSNAELRSRDVNQLTDLLSKLQKSVRSRES